MATTEATLRLLALTPRQWALLLPLVEHEIGTVRDLRSIALAANLPVTAKVKAEELDELTELLGAVLTNADHAGVWHEPLPRRVAEEVEVAPW